MAASKRVSEWRNKYGAKADKMMASILGLYIGDAAAVPVHWYYTPGTIERDYGAPLTTYVDPVHPHPDAFAWSMTFTPKEGSPVDILHARGRLCNNGKGDVKPAPEDNPHYHFGLVAGDNTLNARLTRLLVRVVSGAQKKGDGDNVTDDTTVDPDHYGHPDIPEDLPPSIGGYSGAAWLVEMSRFMQDKDSHNDFYCEVYLRRFFERRSHGIPLLKCAVSQKAVWSVGSMGGLLFPFAFAAAMGMAGKGGDVEAVVKHAMLTHRSENVARCLRVLIPHLMLVSEEGADVVALAKDACSKVGIPKLTGLELLNHYREAQGPNNIPTEEMYKHHTEMEEPAVWSLTDEEIAKEVNYVIGREGRFATSCYTEHGTPGILYLQAKHCAGGRVDFEGAVWAAVNALGECASRAAVVGSLMAAAGGSACIPPKMIDGLTRADDIVTEMEALADAMCAK